MYNWAKILLYAKQWTLEQVYSERQNTFISSSQFILTFFFNVISEKLKSYWLLWVRGHYTNYTWPHLKAKLQANIKGLNNTALYSLNVFFCPQTQAMRVPESAFCTPCTVNLRQGEGEAARGSSQLCCTARSRVTAGESRVTQEMGSPVCCFFLHPVTGWGRNETYKCYWTAADKM